MSDIGILLELIGFSILIIHQLPPTKRLKKRDKTKGFYESLFFIGIGIVILGLVIQLSIFCV